MTITTPDQQINRDRWGRPLVIPPGGGKPIAYRRCTSYVDVIDDKFQLQQWMQRMVAIGLSERADLALAVAAHKDDKGAMNKICKDAMEAAKAHAAATTGTALHSLTEQIDRGQEVKNVPAEYVADLAAYTEATKELRPVLIEQFCVLDTHQVGGTPDRVVEYGGKRYIADLKTGSIEWGALKIAAQLAVYARSHTYDIPTGQRDTHGADLKRGIIIHAPAGTGVCTLHWVDLMAGWDAVRTAKSIWEKRALKFGDLCEPLKQIDLADAIPLETRIKACATRDEALQLWQDNAALWTDELTAVTKEHLATLQVAS
jgi:hypothetical protein